MLTFFNTLTGRKEEFKPIRADEVSIYTCGPTVYNYAHIGNLRAYVFADVLRRTLEYNGYKVKQVMNVTDIGHLTSDADEGEDKMAKALKREDLPLTLEAMREVGGKYFEAFKKDLQDLNIELPERFPRASDPENIEADKEIVKILLEKGLAYKISDGVYFDISKFSGYGKLGNINLAGQKEGARVAVNSEKKNQKDFSLWKFNSELGWDAPWGKGFPGWHLECSAMSRKYLGQPFDIHTGGIDHIPVHHQNEIAQSEAAYDAPLANYWLHNEHLNLGGPASANGSDEVKKMAKSGENFITLQTLKDRGIHPLAYRYYLLQAHYRSPLNFNLEALKAAQAAYYKLLYKFIGLDAGGKFRVNPLRENILQTINDDLNTSSLISEIWAGFQTPIQNWEREIILDYDKILGLDIENQAKKLSEEMNATPNDIKLIAQEREEARKIKDFKKSDELRAQIGKEGYEVMDTDLGPIIRKIIR